MRRSCSATWSSPSATILRLYRDVLDLVEAGRAKVVLVTEFHPSLRVILRLVDQSGNAVADVFTYQTSSARSKLAWN